MGGDGPGKAVTYPIGTVCRITDPGAVWDKGDVVTVVGHYCGELISAVQPWPIVRGSGEDRVINPERLRPVMRRAAGDGAQLEMF